MKKAPFPFQKDKNKEPELGFGSSITQANARMLNPDGSFNIIRTGYRNFNWFQTMIDMSWTQFLIFIFSFYTIVNLFFGMIYYFIGPHELNGLTLGNSVDEFLQCFFFSIQTYTTVGYGGMHPRSNFSASVAGVEALTGLLTFAIITGLVYSKFSKPKAVILFSENIIVAPYQGISSLQIRAANPRNNNILNVEATITASFIAKDQHSNAKTFRALNLELKRIELFPLNWTLVHALNDTSPLFGYNEQDFKTQQVEILVFLRGHDDTYNQQVHSMRSYLSSEMVWNAKFDPMFEFKDGHANLYLEKINNYTRLD